MKNEGRIALIKQFGLHWPRNQGNLDELEDLAGHKFGIYVLYHGMPVYRARRNQCAAVQPWSGRIQERTVLGPVFVVGDRENSIGARVGIIVARGAAVLYTQFE